MADDNLTNLARELLDADGLGEDAASRVRSILDEIEDLSVRGSALVDQRRALHASAEEFNETNEALYEELAGLIPSNPLGGMTIGR
jgi:hypothetical protein